VTVVRSRQAGISLEDAHARPYYAKVLRLRYLRPSGLTCFVLFEGSVTVGVLLALAELADWWAAAVLPISVAAMVKLNDVVAGALADAASAAVPKARGRAKVGGLRQATTGGTAAEWVGSPEQRARQSATHRYDDYE
jgi:hypothetical protein